jgi:hypothetical protein
MEKLIGGTIEDIPEVYEDRSPVTHADRIVSPLIVSHTLSCILRTLLIETCPDSARFG